jgi:anti-sigma-K factor RskA
MWSWSMHEDEDIDGLAAEYVLGSLEPRERREVEERCNVARSKSVASAIGAYGCTIGSNQVGDMLVC